MLEEETHTKNIGTQSKNFMFNTSCLTNVAHVFEHIIQGNFTNIYVLKPVY
jgi:hypothetical protein